MELPKINPKLVEEESRGRQAKELLENPLLVQALSTMRAEFRQAWEASPARDTEGRERIWQLCKLLDRLELCLKETVTTGRMAEIQIEETRSLVERMKDGMRSYLG